MSVLKHNLQIISETMEGISQTSQMTISLSNTLNKTDTGSNTSSWVYGCWINGKSSNLKELDLSPAVGDSRAASDVRVSRSSGSKTIIGVIGPPGARLARYPICGESLVRDVITHISAK